MTGIEQHRAQSNPLAHLHHHQTIMQTPEVTSSQLTTDRLTTRDDETHDLRAGTAQGPDRATTPDPPPDQCRERRLSRESMIKIRSFQSRQPIGDNKEASHEPTLKDLSLTTNSSFDSPTPSLPPESTSQASWRHESQASRSATTTTTRIFNRWLNKEVPYTTMEFSDSIRRPLTISSPNLATSKTRTITDPASSSMAATSRLNQSWDPATQPATSPNLSSTGTPQISTSSNNLTSQNLDVSLLRRKYISPDRPTSTSLGDSLQNLSSHPRPPDVPPRPSATHRLDSSPPKRPLKAYNSDSSLATSYTEERKQILLKRHPEVRASSRRADSSPRKNPPAHPAPSASRPQVKAPWPKQEPPSQRCLNRPPPKESPQPRAALNKTLAETLWGKQLGADENQTLCRNSLPRQSPASGARSKSLDEQLSEVEIEIQDILAQPLLSESNISSPSLFDETPTISSQSSSPQTTVQTLQ